MKSALILALVFAVSCSKSAPDSDVVSEVNPEAEETKETPKAKPESNALNIGKECRVDLDCEKYLRCVEAACAVPPAITGKKDDTTPYVTFATEAGDQKFFMETAISDAEMMRGLMYRTEMLDDWGMVFIYPGEGVRSFWMKNTLIPLDMIFVSKTGDVVGVVEGAEPLTLTSRSVGKPSRYVVELNAGLAKKHGIVEGTKMTIDNVDPTYRVP